MDPPAWPGRDGTPARQSRPKADPCAAPEHPMKTVSSGSVHQRVHGVHAADFGAGVGGHQALVYGVVQALELPVAGMAGDGQLVQAFQQGEIAGAGDVGQCFDQADGGTPK